MLMLFLCNIFQWGPQEEPLADAEAGGKCVSKPRWVCNWIEYTGLLV